MNQETTRQEKEKKIVFFDGVCQLCNKFVDFLITQDFRTFYYAPLQGETAQKLLSQDQTQKLDSVIYFEDGKALSKAQAITRIFLQLSYPWKIIGLLGNLLPDFAGNFIYDIVAKNRYQWFGQKDQCRIPSAEEKSQFLP